MGLEGVTRKVERRRAVVFDGKKGVDESEGGEISYNMFRMKDTTLANSVKRMKEKKRGGLIGVLSLAVLAGIGYCGWHEYNIYSRLDKNSAYCNPVNNLMPDQAIKRFFPGDYVYEKNKDIDNDGRFESIEIYRDQSGKWIYYELDKYGGKGKPKEF